MKQRRRIYYTKEQQALMWNRWQQGDTLHTIAKLFDRYHPSIQGVLSRTGGIRPPERKRSSIALTLAEREHISRGLACGDSMRCIARQLNRAPSTICRQSPRYNHPVWGD